MSIYDFTVTTPTGEEVSLSDYRGKVLLIVNTAMGCGFTPQYDGLQDLYDKYAHRGLEILDFPCNQFGNQAPDSSEEIVHFCNVRFGVTFPQFAKIEVNGPNAHPLFTYLKQHKKGILGANIRWNFTKFLVDREGNVTDRFSSFITPERMEEIIVELLAQ